MGLAYRKTHECQLHSRYIESWLNMKIEYENLLAYASESKQGFWINKNNRSSTGNQGTQKKSGYMYFCVHIFKSSFFVVVFLSLFCQVCVELNIFFLFSSLMVMLWRNKNPFSLEILKQNMALMNPSGRHLCQTVAYRSTLILKKDIITLLGTIYFPKISWMLLYLLLMKKQLVYLVVKLPPQKLFAWQIIEAVFGSIVMVQLQTHRRFLYAHTMGVIAILGTITAAPKSALNITACHFPDFTDVRRLNAAPVIAAGIVFLFQEFAHLKPLKTVIAPNAHMRDKILWTWVIYI